MRALSSLVLLTACIATSACGPDERRDRSPERTTTLPSVATVGVKAATPKAWSRSDAIGGFGSMGDPDPSIQASMDRLDPRTRGDVMRLMMCRSMLAAKVLDRSERMEAYRRASRDLTSDPTAAEVCMRTLGARGRASADGRG